MLTLTQLDLNGGRLVEVQKAWGTAMSVQGKKGDHQRRALIKTTKQAVLTGSLQPAIAVSIGQHVQALLLGKLLLHELRGLKGKSLDEHKQAIQHPCLPALHNFIHTHIKEPQVKLSLHAVFLLCSLLVGMHTPGSKARNRLNAELTQTLQQTANTLLSLIKSSPGDKKSRCVEPSEEIIDTQAPPRTDSFEGIVASHVDDMEAILRDVYGMVLKVSEGSCYYLSFQQEICHTNIVGWLESRMHTLPCMHPHVLSLCAYM